MCHSLRLLRHISNTLALNNGHFTERGGSVVTHEIRIREVPGSNPVAGQPG